MSKMRCVLCGSQTIKKSVEYKESEVLLGNFNAFVCQKCDETYFDGNTAEKIQNKSKQMKLFG